MSSVKTNSSPRGPDDDLPRLETVIGKRPREETADAAAAAPPVSKATSGKKGGMASKSRAGMPMLTPQQQQQQMEITQWKKHIPILYDFIWSHHLVWPTLCVRWGQILESYPYITTQRLFFTERGSDNNVLVVAKVEIFKKRVCMPDSMTSMGDVLSQSKHCTVQRKIPIPDNQEINRMMNSTHRPGILVAKTDASPLFAWVLDHLEENHPTEVPSLTLRGHSDAANESSFALATSSHTNSILSGDKQNLVLLWRMEDEQSALAVSNKKSGGIELHPQQVFSGHSSSVEDVCFRPSSAHEFATVGLDQMMCLWDTRKGTVPAQKIMEVAPVDVSCLDWNPTDDRHIIVGAADGNLRLFDTRNMGGTTARPLHVFKSGHQSPVYRVEWSRHSQHHFASAGEDKFLLCWDTQKMGHPIPQGEPVPVPAEVIMNHAGHRSAIADFQWNPYDEWSIVSVSEDSEDIGGGTMQTWRMNDMLYRPENEVLSEMSRFHQMVESQ